MRARRLPLLCLALAACAGPGETTAVFSLPGAEGHAFFDTPWPSDLYRTREGTIDLRGFPNDRRVPLVEEYKEALTTRLGGFGTNTPVYFSFDGPLDASSLPRSAEATLAPDASVLLVDVDPRSPDRGARHPAVAVYREEPTVFWPAHTVAIRPVYGIPLAPGRTYAAVVTDRLRAAGGGRVRRSPDLDALLGDRNDPTLDAARAAHAAALEALPVAGVSLRDVVSLAVFTTQDPTRELIAARDHVVASYPAPAADPTAWERLDQTETHTLVAGRYGPSPNLQQGTIPFESEGGEILFGDDGAPLVAGDLTLRFALSVPRSAPPAGGYPLVLYAHGTGGDYRSFERGGVAATLAAEGLAVLGIDQIHHGERNPTGTDPALLFFNFLNPAAFRDNGRQAAIDVVQQARLVASLEVPAALLGSAAPARFDPARVFFYGHSQGGNNGPLFLAIDDHARAGLLSGAAATLTVSLVEKKEPFDIPALVALFLRIPGEPAAAVEREHIVYEHPVLALLQTWREVDDNANYVHLLFAAPRDGFAPKSILQTEGTSDLYTTAHAVESLAAAARIPLLEPSLAPIEALALRGIAPEAEPAQDNVAGGAATAGLVQYETGHFTATQNATARAQVAGFFRSLVADAPAIPAR